MSVCPGALRALWDEAASLRAPLGTIGRATVIHPAQASGRVVPTPVSYAQAASATSFTTLVYRSRAAQPLSGIELVGLTEAAQARNRSESITGLVLYDDARFFQWLEGPDDSLSRVMNSISNDVRHTDIEILTCQRTGTRTFPGWDMKLALAGAAPAKWTREVITPSHETLEALRRRPEMAAAVLERLAPRPCPSGRARTPFILETVIRESVIPQLASRYFPAPPGAFPVRPHPRAADLANILLTGDTEAALAFIREQSGRSSTPSLFRANLIEPAARHLGDLWMQDECSEFDVTLGLCSLQTAIRRFEPDVPISYSDHTSAGVVLVVPQPGEPHGLNAALAAQAFRRAGWAVRCDFPDNDEALQDLVAADWFNVIDMSLSAAFRREDRLPAMARNISLTRSVSRNPALKVTVGGRIFAEQETAVAQVGADARNDAIVGLRCP